MSKFNFFRKKDFIKINKRRFSIILLGGLACFLVAGFVAFGYSRGWLRISALSEIQNTASMTYQDASGATQKVTSNPLSIPLVSLDTQPPTNPSNLVGKVVGSNQIDLSWTASTDNVAVAGYKIKRNSTELGNKPTTNSYSDQNLTAGQTYTYQVAAFDAAGNTSNFVPSPALSITIPAPQAGGALVGKVTNSRTGAPLASVTVSLIFSGTVKQSMVTTTDGTYKFDNISPGTYTVKVSKKQFWGQSQQVTIVSGQQATLNFSLTGWGKSR